MKKIKTFENFNEKVNEFVDAPYPKNINTTKSSSDRISNEIDSAIAKYDPDTFVKYDLSTLKDKLMTKAKENGYRGSIVIRKSANDPKSANANKKFIVYDPKETTLQSLGAAASNARRS